MAFVSPGSQVARLGPGLRAGPPSPAEKGVQERRAGLLPGASWSHPPQCVIATSLCPQNIKHAMRKCKHTNSKAKQEVWRYSLTSFANNGEAPVKAFAAATAHEQHYIPGRRNGDSFEQGGDLERGSWKAAVVKSTGKLRAGPRNGQAILLETPSLTRLIEQNRMVINVRSQEDETRERKGVLWEGRSRVNWKANTSQNI